MARVTHVKKAQQRYKMVPVIDPATGEQKKTPVMRRNGEQKTTKKGKPVFLRVTVADKSQPLPNLRCEKCGKEIEVGDPYKHVSPKSGPYGGRKRIRCAKCPGWRPSELTGSAALSTLYAAQEEAGDALAQWDRQDAEGLRDILSALSDGVREAGEVYRESAQNMEDGFGHPTYQSEELTEKADNLESAADDINSAADDIEDFDEDEVRSQVEDEALSDTLAELGIELEDETLEVAQDHESWDQEVYEARVEALIDEARDEWADEQQNKAEEAMEVDVY